ncbi:hypothetical protein L1049_015393 [Liquidambar formosana]|uniref:Uncharacterized protein n=1 Tax=Liquidambar formosana TaxID=63359 RepID=A0AAP0S4T3_LIQFO
MEESQSSQQINNEVSDEFYEEIEAPKFVDLTVPDPYRPDDRYWFCLRVGCDQKHEEELDSEAVYKNFVLRVMAARSPNVRLRKALYRKAPSASMKCPLSAPAKSSKARVSRLAIISSISQKIGDAKVKVRPLPKLSSTPNVKANQSSIASKALTTPRNKKCLPNPDSFRSVRNPKATIIQVPKSRVVAKALVFHSPKKTIKSKTSLELDTPVKKICEGMKKLEITSQRKRVLGYSIKSSKDIRRDLNKPLPLEASSKQLNKQKVKSRVEDSLHSQSCKAQKAKSSRCLERKSKENIQKCSDFVPHEGVEKDSNDMEIDGKSRNVSLAVHLRSGSSKSNEGNGHEELLTTEKHLENFSSAIPTQEKATSSLEQPPLEENSDPGLSNASRGDMNSPSISEETDSVKKVIPKFQALNGQGDGSHEGSEHEEKIKSSSENGKISEGEPPEYQTLEGAGHDSEHEEKIKSSSENKKISEGEPPEYQTSEGAGHDSEVLDSDDKENASAPDENRELNLSTKHSGMKLLGRSEACENNQKVTRILNKTLKDGLACVTTGAQGSKYRKPKPTNPKPFRLRTDERGILKEANMEKRFLLLTPVKETTTFPRFPSAKSQRKHDNDIQRNEKYRGQSKNNNDTNEGSEEASQKITPINQPQQVRTACMKTPKGQVEPKTGRITLERRTVSTNQKPSHLTSRLGCDRDNAVQKSANSIRKTKSLSLRHQLVRPRGVTPTRKAVVSPMTPGQLSVIKEKSSKFSRLEEAGKPSENDAIPATKASASTAPRSSSRGKRPSTVPKEPNFHSIHVPKSCTRKLA